MLVNRLFTKKDVQTEVDAGYEGENHIILIEGKNSKNERYNN